MIYLKKFNENIDNGILVYHGGGKLSNKNIRGVIFTTTEKWATLHYITGGVGRDGYLTTMNVKITNPLTLENSKIFEEKWLPLLKEAGIKYEFYIKGETDMYMKNNINTIILNDQRYKNYKKGDWYVDYEKYDGTFDIIYNKNFIKVAKKHGYDGIIGYDTFFQGDIEIYIPFYKENIDVISSEKLSKIKDQFNDEDYY